MRFAASLRHSVALTTPFLIILSFAVGVAGCTIPARKKAVDVHYVDGCFIEIKGLAATMKIQERMEWLIENCRLNTDREPSPEQGAPKRE